jgi:hypothetical protein
VQHADQVHAGQTRHASHELLDLAGQMIHPAMVAAARWPASAGRSTFKDFRPGRGGAGIVQLHVWLKARLLLRLSCSIAIFRLSTGPDAFLHAARAARPRTPWPASRPPSAW